MSKLMQLVEEYGFECLHSGDDEQRLLSEIRAAVAELERIEKAARDYATRYVQDEADDVRNCFNERQHDSAKELIEALSAIAPIRAVIAMEAANVPER